MPTAVTKRRFSKCSLPCSAVNLRGGREANLVNNVCLFVCFLIGRQRHEGVCLCFVCLFVCLVRRALGSGPTLEMRLDTVQTVGTEPPELGSVCGSRARCSANGTRALCCRFALMRSVKS